MNLVGEVRDGQLLAQLGTPGRDGSLHLAGSVARDARCLQVRPSHLLIYIIHIVRTMARRRSVANPDNHCDDTVTPFPMGLMRQAFQSPARQLLQIATLLLPSP